MPIMIGARPARGIGRLEILRPGRPEEDSEKTAAIPDKPAEDTEASRKPAREKEGSTDPAEAIVGSDFSYEVL